MSFQVQRKMLLFRLLIDSIFYGPQLTYEGATSKSIGELLALPFDPKITPVFIGRVMIDGFSMFGAFLLIGLVGGMANQPTPKRKKRFSDEEENSTWWFPFDGIPSVQQAIEGSFEKIVHAIEKS